ncbi:MAG: hypothetical protein ACJ8BW_15385 [Ktedonobacteraceae bacterium]
MMYFRAFPSILREEMTVQECSRIRTLGMNRSMTSITWRATESHGLCASGNGVYTQKQLNIYGEALDAIHIMSGFRGIYYEGWMKLVKMLDWLGKKRLQAYCLAT